MGKQKINRIEDLNMVLKGLSYVDEIISSME